MRSFPRDANDLKHIGESWAPAQPHLAPGALPFQRGVARILTHNKRPAEPLRNKIQQVRSIQQNYSGLLKDTAFHPLHRSMRQSHARLHP